MSYKSEPVSTYKAKGYDPVLDAQYRDGFLNPYKFIESLFQSIPDNSVVVSAKAVADTQILIGDGTGFTAASLSGDVTMTNAGVVTIAATAVENSMLAGSIANAKLANSTVSFVGISLALGDSDATPSFDLADATNYPTSSLSGTITNAQLAGSIAE